MRDSSSKYSSPEYYINREISWLRFNDRVLEEAMDKTTPLLERVRFITICENNLDEFFMVRVAGLKQKIENEIKETGPDGMTSEEQLSAIRLHLLGFYRNLYGVLNRELLPVLLEKGIEILKPEQLPVSKKRKLRQIYKSEIYPILTPLAIDPGRPFPRLANRRLNLAVRLTRPKQEKNPLFAVVQVPQVLPRLLPLHNSYDRKGHHTYVFLEDVISYFMKDLFPGFKILDVTSFRITRDSDLIIEEDEVDDLLATIQRELKRRQKGAAVRLEVRSHAEKAIVAELMEFLNLQEDDVYYCDGPVPLEGFKDLFQDPILEKETYKPFTPITPVLYEKPAELFRVIAKQDVFVHHPFDSFSVVEDFVAAAANDPDVLAIKQTLYRTGSQSRILDSLITAARNGKQVTALVELQARFDEETNIQWAKRLEEEGIHVVYGLVGVKTHCKICLVVRKEGRKIQPYVHLSTGNYNAITARIYTDVGLFTADPDLSEDITNLFNVITGYARIPVMKKIHISPGFIKKEILARIKKETEYAKKGKPASIFAKMNALVDADVIRELYIASSAGVKITLLVRGICCLRPGIKDISENIQVISIVGRLLEHSRIFIFENGGNKIYYFSSADWMPRNFNRRIEVMWPIEDSMIRQKIDEIKDTYLKDNVKARIMQPDGTYIRRQDKEKNKVNAQEIFIEKTREKLSAREKKSDKKKVFAQKKQSHED
ncbi:MAG: polyphosphate kinase 1 [Candidatus Hydrogenedentota bacterium]|nr:MAG: polyphosphate kinase 1 [Candidatus Hydrogenedentota bacterium]